MKKLPALACFALVAALAGCSLFRPNNLTIVITPEGGGTVSVDPDQDSFVNGRVVTITAEAAAGFEFHAFLDGDTVLQALDPVVELTMDTDKVLEVSFWEAVGNEYSGSGDQVFLVDADSPNGMVYTLDLGSTHRDVYMAFTNLGTAAAGMPVVTQRMGDFGTPPAPRSLAPAPAFQGPVAMRGSPITRDFEEEGRRRLEAARARVAPRGLTDPKAPLLADVPGEPGDFYYASTGSADTIHATNRWYNGVPEGGPFNGKTLSIWVADDMWGGTITSAMVQALAGKFLAAGVGDDIYEWVTAIYGDEWGAHDYPLDLIPGDDTITILLYDIDGDAETFQEAGGVVGFFWAKDNYLNSGSFDYSNERIMFYMDAPMLAAEDVPPGDGWSIDDWWPEEVVSTLAHEFQHMIRYYQKDVLRNANTGSETWLNELSSMVTEDFVSKKLDVPGPRGVDPVLYSDGSAGAPGMSGFPALYNDSNWTPVTAWDQTLENYAVNYAFGAYLARNYGGALFFRDVVQSGDTGRDAVDTALTAGDYGETFETVLRKWAAAVLLSDNTAAPSMYRYNTGSWIQADAGSAQYELGSVNLYNYSYGNQDGPYLWTDLPTVDIPGSSTYFYVAAEGATGKVVWALDLAPDVLLEVVVKD